MTNPADPSKSQVWHRQRQEWPEQDSPPSNEEIRRQLGTDLIAGERQERAERDE